MSGKSSSRVLRRRHRPSFASRQLGRSIIEVMIASTIGIVVMGTVLTLVGNASRGTRTQDGQSKLTENAQVGLNVLASHVRQSGFSLPRLNTIPGRQFANYEGAAVRGCDSAFADPVEPDLALTACVGNGTPNALAVAYEADAFNTLLLAPGQPSDCLGRPLAAQVSAIDGANFFVAENRFYLRNNATTGDPELVCDGNGGAGFGAAQPIVSNVEDFQVWFGVSDTTTTQFGNTVFSGVVASYLTGDQLDAQFIAEPLLNRWSRVNSVRICLLMRTDDFVADEATPYVDCQGNVIDPPDRRLRYAVSTTINLRNNSALAE
ncbi:MAG: PilW family protein [Burkholderiaceae bacterium]